jgi:RNA polymerase sigma-70 factor, ECF subfamily
MGILCLADKKKENTPLEALGGVEATDSIPSGSEQQAMLRNMAGLRAQLTRVTGNIELASDLLHDAVVTALQKLQAGEIKDPTNLDGYVYRVALNHFRNYRRKDKSRLTSSEDTPEPADETESRPVTDVEAAQWSRLVKQVLQEVRLVRDRELLVRFYLQEESKEDLCHAYGLSELHFNRVIHRARDRFRELLQQRGLSKSDFLSIAAILLLVAGV